MLGKMRHTRIPYQKGSRIFLRHAHRDIQDRSLDNGLSPKGLIQGKRLAEWLCKKSPFQPLRVFSSPKKRCLETATFVCEAFKLELEILDALDEQGPSESEMDFKKRIKKLIQSPDFSDRSLFCSHGDVLPELAALLGAPQVFIEKGNLFIENGGIITEINPI